MVGVRKGTRTKVGDNDIINIYRPLPLCSIQEIGLVLVVNYNFLVNYSNICFLCYCLKQGLYYVSLPGLELTVQPRLNLTSQ